MGIMTIYGFWFNLNSREWETKRSPPTHPWATPSNGLFTFRNRATVFGNPDCNLNGFCPYKRIIQYDPDLDDWIDMDFMLESRQYHTVVRVPGEFCDHFVEPMTTTTRRFNMTTIPSKGNQIVPDLTYLTVIVCIFLMQYLLD